MKKKKWLLTLLAAEGIIFFTASAIWTAKKTVKDSNFSIIHASVPVLSSAPTASTPPTGAAKQIHNPSKNHPTGKDKKTVKEIKKLYKENMANLVLVNKNYALDETFDAALMPICNGRLYASERLYNDLTQMLADAKQECHSYWIASAYRSRDKQQRLVDEDVRLGMQKGLSYEQALEETYRETMPAGHSEHETGLALDILCSENTTMDISQENEPGNIWLQMNCYRYGFILRYPKDKETVTNISFEPWHFRYVGKNAAKYMYEHHMTLEEFWAIGEL